MRKRYLDGRQLGAFIAGFGMMPLSRIWFGDYLALYLELGASVGVYQRSRRTKHERHIFAGYDWLLTDNVGTEMPRSDMTESLILKLLGNSRVLCVSLDSREELLVRFDNDCQLRTWGTEHPEWSLWEHPNKNVSYENGRPTLEIDQLE